MATRSRTTFKKRQKELARLEKQRDKAARKAQRKLAGPEPDVVDPLDRFGGLDLDTSDLGESADADAGPDTPPDSPDASSHNGHD